MVPAASFRSNTCTLLSPEEFRRAVLARNYNRCVLFKDNASGNSLAVRHIMEERLWDDGCFYRDNGVTLCGNHFALAMRTIVTPEDLRKSAGIVGCHLPNTSNQTYATTDGRIPT